MTNDEHTIYTIEQMDVCDTHVKTENIMFLHIIQIKMTKMYIVYIGVGKIRRRRTYLHNDSKNGGHSE